MMVQRIVCCSALAAVFGIASVASAGEITGFTWASGINSVAGESIPPLDSPNNDDVVGDSDNEVFILQKHYVDTGPVDLIFDVEDSGGVTEYVVIEGVDNSTGLPWTAYHLELGFGSGAGFTKSPASDGLDFDAPLYYRVIGEISRVGRYLVDVFWVRMAASAEALDDQGGSPWPSIT